MDITLPMGKVVVNTHGLFSRQSAERTIRDRDHNRHSYAVCIHPARLFKVDRPHFVRFVHVLILI